MNNELKIIGTKIINDKEIREVEGGFGKNQKCILASDVAKQHDLRLDKINALINNNIGRFNDNDIIDFLKPSEGLRDFARENGLFTNNRTKNIFLLSERGYTKLVAMMDNSNEKKWEVMDSLIDNYFTMRIELKMSEKDRLLLNLFSNDPIVVSSSHKKLVELEVKEATTPLLETIEEQKPKAEFYDDVAGSSDAIAMGEVAKVLKIKGYGRNNLFEFLRNKKVLQRNNQPYQKYIDLGYFRVVETKFNKPNGDIGINIKTLVYQKGLEYIRKLVLKEVGEN